MWLPALQTVCVPQQAIDFMQNLHLANLYNLNPSNFADFLKIDALGTEWGALNHAYPQSAGILVQTLGVQALRSKILQSGGVFERYGRWARFTEDDISKTLANRTRNSECFFTQVPFNTIIANKFVDRLRYMNVLALSSKNIHDKAAMEVLWQDFDACKTSLPQQGLNAVRDLNRLMIMDAVIALTLKFVPIQAKREEDKLREEAEIRRREDERQRLDRERAKRSEEEMEKSKAIASRLEQERVERRRAQFNKKQLIDILSIDVCDPSQWRRVHEIYHEVLYDYADVANDEVKNRIRQLITDIEKIRAERGKKSLAVKDMQGRIEGRTQRIAELENRLKRIENS